MLLIPFFACIDDEVRRRVAGVIRTACVRSYGSIKAACIDMGVRQSHFCAALDGERGLPVGFLNLSVKFYAWLAFGLVDEFGVPREIRSAIRLMFGVLGRRRMVKADIQARRVA